MGICRKDVDNLFKRFRAINCHAQITAMPIYDKHLKIFFSRTKKALRLNLGTQHRGLKVYKICSNDDSRMTFDLFRAWSNLCPSCCGNTGRSCIMAFADMK